MNRAPFSSYPLQPASALPGRHRAYVRMKAASPFPIHLVCASGSSWISTRTPSTTLAVLPYCQWDSVFPGLTLTAVICRLGRNAHAPGEIG